MKETGLKMAFQNIVDLDNPDNDRTLDPETGAYLVYEGGRNIEERVHRFSLYWNNIKIPFDARQDSIEDKNGHSVGTHWVFFGVDTAKNLKEHREEIIKIITVALEAHGFLYEKDDGEVVTAEYQGPVAWAP